MMLSWMNDNRLWIVAVFLIVLATAASAWFLAQSVRRLAVHAEKLRAPGTMRW
jgi:MscS family membrane protein